jgi:ribonucleoside-diphosphate reductase alpha chain
MESFKFRTEFGKTIFHQKYAHEGAYTWNDLCKVLVRNVCSGLMSESEIQELTSMMVQMKFIPGGRYLYYANRERRFYNNCFLLRAEEDTREDWGSLANKSLLCLMSGGGIGIDYSRYRPEGSVITKTGGTASGPISMLLMINEIGRNVMQGGSRRSAIYGSLNWKHKDAHKFLRLKDWDNQLIGETGWSMGDLKKEDFNFHCPADMTNISLNYDNAFLEELKTGIPEIFIENVRFALKNGEPGFSFNFGAKENETLRNACTEVTSEDDSDVCNLGSLNFSRIKSIEELKDVVELSTKFLLCGTLKAELPYKKVYEIREKNRRLGLGIMGLHEWLIIRGSKYEVTSELREWLKIYKDVSDKTSKEFSEKLSISVPVANRAIAPTGTIGTLAGTTTGIEPIFSVAYKRRYLVGGKTWKYQYVVEPVAKYLIETYGVNPDNIESAVDLAVEYERRIKFQADIQDYVDQGISSTINMPSWGSKYNNESIVLDFAKTLIQYAPRLRGFTCYPDGARGGQPLESVDYTTAMKHDGVVFEETNVCDLTKGGVCGM